MIRRSFVAAILIALATPALAHPGGLHTHGLVDGFMHPFAGADHVLAMVAVGLWAGLVGGRAMLAWPLAFVAFVGIGGAAGMAGVQLPFVEVAIALSVVALGAAVAFGVRAPLAVGGTLCAVFALFHGVAHGAEMPSDAAGFAYGVGFTAATLALHGLGLVGAATMKRVSRVAGAAVAAAGAVLLVG